MAQAKRWVIPGVILIVVGRLAAMGRLPRNPLVGIRIPSTLRSKEAWRVGHVAGATALTVAGVGQLGVAALDAANLPQFENRPMLSRIGTAWLLGWLGVATLQASRAAKATTLR
jgi:uncharacterized membrane protein